MFYVDVNFFIMHIHVCYKYVVVMGPTYIVYLEIFSVVTFLMFSKGSRIRKGFPILLTSILFISNILNVFPTYSKDTSISYTLRIFYTMKPFMEKKGTVMNEIFPTLQNSLKKNGKDECFPTYICRTSHLCEFLWHLKEL